MCSVWLVCIVALLVRCAGTSITRPWKRMTPFPACKEKKVDVTVHPTVVTHHVSNLTMGCHLDSGYGQELRALFAQRLFSASFEMGNPMQPLDRKKHPNGLGWLPLSGNSEGLSYEETGGMTDDATVTIERTERESGTILVGLTNRGLGFEGLFFEAGKNYEGYIFARAAAATELVIRFEDYTVHTTLAEAVLPVVGSGAWEQLTFDLFVNASTSCVGISLRDPVVTCNWQPGTDDDEAAHVCVRCGGQFTVGLAGPGRVTLTRAFLQPGSWARVGGLPLLQSGVNALKSMGVSLLRAGGTVSKDPRYTWKSWIHGNRPWLRPPFVWGGEDVSGFGPFEILDLAHAAGMEVVLALASVGQTPESMADLVEYCYGGIQTRWGRIRTEEDSHPEAYPLRYIELGNEEENPGFPAQVSAMEARRVDLGLPSGRLVYVYPRGGGDAGVGGPLDNKTKHEITELGLGTGVAVDQHVYAAGGVYYAKKLLEDPEMGPGGWGAINLETNCGDHTFLRALTEAQDLMTFFSFRSSRLLGRAASFCLERSGYNEGGWNDQGLVFYLPNMTWLQPPAYVHQMIASAWRSDALLVDSSDCGTVCGSTTGGPGGAGTSCAHAAAQRGVDGLITLQLLNMGTSAVDFNVTFSGHATAVAHGWQLHATHVEGVNTPSDPLKIVPRKVSVDLHQSIFVPAQTFLVVELDAWTDEEHWMFAV